MRREAIGVGLVEQGFQEMTAKPAVARSDACDVFLSHVGGHYTNTFIDCLRRILLCVGGTNGKQAHGLKVFIAQHSLATWKTGIPWHHEPEAQDCHVGGHTSTDQACCTCY
jgi:hypothetical protein